MRYRKLGKTGLLVSEVSFGTIPILSGHVPVLPNYYSPDEKTAIKIMLHAYLLGCNLFDTAIVPEYGDAEIKLGIFANYIGRNHIIISDKARYFDGNAMYQAVLQSYKNLQTEPDIYFVHQVDLCNADQTFQKNGAIEALQELKLEGKIKYIGVASHYYDVLERGAKDHRVDVLQGSGNVLERGMLDRIEENEIFQEKGILINKVYAAGILPRFFLPHVLIENVLSYPVSSALIGIGTIGQAELAMKVTYNQIKRMKFLKVIETLERYFNPIPCDRCQRCICPYGIEIHILFRQYNYYFLGKDYWAIRKLDLNIDESFMQCRQCISMDCMKLCPKALHIPELIEKIYFFVKIHIRNSRI